MTRAQILTAAVVAVSFALPMQANAATDEAKCLVRAVKNEAKAVKAIDRAHAKACKAKGDVSKVEAKIEKTAEKLRAKLVRIAAKNDALDDKLEGACDAAVSSLPVTGADPYGAGQTPVPSVGTWESVLGSTQSLCNPV